jgi:GT2 family glycosyltransferase
MKIHVMVPFSPEKNLGAAYNEACFLVPDGDWICLLDHDVMFLTPDAINIMYKYAGAMSTKAENCFLTCRTNRSHPINKEQLVCGEISDDVNIGHHISIATKFAAMEPYTFSVFANHLSGFLMLFPKSLWNEIKFDEGIGCLGVDTKFFAKLKAAGVPTYVMDNLYIWHTYRLQNGINNKEHLK